MAFGRILAHGHTESGFLNRSIGFLNLLTALLALLAFYALKSTFWELDADGLRRRRLWMNATVEWKDVTRVVSLWSSSFYDLKIEYDRHGFGPRTGHILANPEDRDQFLDTLRRFAPQAEYVDHSAKRTLNI